MSRKAEKAANIGKEDAKMAAPAGKVRSVDFSKLTFAKEPLSTAKSIKDVVPVQWPKEVYSGASKVTITHPKK